MQNEGSFCLTEFQSGNVGSPSKVLATFSQASLHEGRHYFPFFQEIKFQATLGKSEKIIQSQIKTFFPIMSVTKALILREEIFLHQLNTEMYCIKYPITLTGLHDHSWNGARALSRAQLWGVQPGVWTANCNVTSWLHWRRSSTPRRAGD